MRKLLLILFFIPVLSFGQFDWTNGWNGNLEVGTPLADISCDRFFSRGYLGFKFYNESILDGRLLVKIGSEFLSQDNFFLMQQNHNKDYRFSALVEYVLFQNNYVSPLIGFGYTRHKSEFHRAPYWYDFLQIDGVTINSEIWFLPKSQFSFGVDLSLGFGRSIEYRFRQYFKGTMFTVPHQIEFTLQYKLFQKEKVFFNKNNE